MSFTEIPAEVTYLCSSSVLSSVGPTISKQWRRTAAMTRNWWDSLCGKQKRRKIGDSKNALTKSLVHYYTPGSNPMAYQTPKTPVLMPYIIDTRIFQEQFPRWHQVNSHLIWTATATARNGWNQKLLIWPLPYDMSVKENNDQIHILTTLFYLITRFNATRDPFHFQKV